MEGGTKNENPRPLDLSEPNFVHSEKQTKIHSIIINIINNIIQY